MKNSVDIHSHRIIRSHLYLKQILVSLIMIFLTPAPAISSDVYKWVGETGEINYSGGKPSNTASEKMDIKIDEAKKITNKEKENRIEDEEIVDAPIEKTEPPEIFEKEKARICKDARSRLQNIQSRGQMREFDEKGESVILSEEERQQRITTIKRLIDKNCR